MKILFALDSLQTGGAEKSTLDTIKHFSKDIETSVVHFYPGFDLKADYEKAGIPMYYIGLTGSRSFGKGIRRLISIIRKEKPDLVISSIMRADLMSRIAGLLTGTKTIGTLINDTYGDIRIEELRRQKLYAKFRVFWWLDKMTASIPRYYIANSLSIAKSNVKALGIARKKITVIHRGRDTSLFPEWQAPALNNKFRFVVIGRLIERKGLRELIQAMAIVKKNHKDIQLDIYGEGSFRGEMEKLVKELQLQDTVSLHGSVLNGWKKLYESHCFVLPSWYEGFSGSLIEAMIAGIPIIASDIPMNLEAANEEMAIIFKVKNVTRLAESMEKMITAYPEMMNKGKQARIYAVNNFDIKVIAHEYESFLKTIVNKTVDTAALI